VQNVIASHGSSFLTCAHLLPAALGDATKSPWSLLTPLRESLESLEMGAKPPPPSLKMPLWAGRRGATHNPYEHTSHAQGTWASGYLHTYLLPT